MTSFGGVPSAFAISFTFGCFSATSTCGAAVASVPIVLVLLAIRHMAERRNIEPLGRTLVEQDVVNELWELIVAAADGHVLCRRNEVRVRRSAVIELGPYQIVVLHQPSIEVA